MKYLAGNGKMYSQTQLDRLNMKQVFDHLISLGVADKQLYQDFKYEQDDSYSPPRARARARASPKYIYRSRSRRRSPRYRVIYGPKPRSPRYRVVYGKRQPAVGTCPHNRNALDCREAGCIWTGISCVSP